jgi:hypothetical protein
MTPEQIAWIAGLFDGEGCITTKDHKDGVRLQAQITNTCRPMLEKVRDVTGLGTITTRYRSNPVWKPVNDWRVAGSNAQDILRAIRPWLIAKAERADFAIGLNLYTSSSPSLTQLDGQVHRD